MKGKIVCFISASCLLFSCIGCKNSIPDTNMNQPTEASESEESFITGETLPSQNSATEDPSDEVNHSWAEATCTLPKTCTICGATEGTALGHAEDADGKCLRCGEVLVEIKDEELEKYTVAACAMNYFFIASNSPETVCFTDVFYASDNGAGDELWLVEGYTKNDSGGNTYSYVYAKVSPDLNVSITGSYSNYELNDGSYAITVARADNPYSSVMQMFTKKLNAKKLQIVYRQLFDKYNVIFVG